MKFFKLFSLLNFVMLFSALNLHSQNDPVLLTVAGEQITKSEFIKIYQKNNIKGDPITKESLEEYLELYINFKLKVKEAEILGLDTNKAFKTELQGYRKQLTQPYFTDKTVDSLLLAEAYERSKWDIRASHILVKVAPNALPEDTLKKYEQIMAIRKRIIKGESFEAVAKDASEDPSARDSEANEMHPFMKGNAGDLGYFTVFDIVYPFETAAYNLKVGEISMPVRTDYGYHLIKVYDRKKAMGKVQVAHILIAIPAEAQTEDLPKYEQKADSIYKAIQAGADFDEMAKQFSDDKGSATKGGVLPWFGCFRMVPEFIEAISKLEKKGDMPKPVLTSYGWHIIKLTDKKDVGSFEETKNEYKNNIQRQGRSAKSQEAVLARIKKEYQFKEDISARNDFYNVVTDSIFKNKWEVKEAAGLNKTMFTLGNKNYTQHDFANYINQQQNNGIRQDNIKIVVNDLYGSWVKESCFDYEDKNIENKDPEFKALMKEYRDGILLFDLTDQNVWSKAVKDTTGLRNFYEQHKNNYMWGERVEASVYKCANESIAKTTRKLLKKFAKKGYGKDSLLKTINTGEVVSLEIQTGKFPKGANKYVDAVSHKKTGLSSNFKMDDKVVFVNIIRLLSPQPKELKEIKGIMTAEYQKYLDEQWIKELRAKYPYSVNKEVLNSIVQ